MALAGKSSGKNSGTIASTKASTYNEPLDALCGLSGASRTGFRGLYE